jgi:hypothetical protein
VVVTGLRRISDFFSVQMPQYMPLMVVHDPPGGKWCFFVLCSYDSIISR